MDYKVSIHAIDYLANLYDNKKINKLSVLKLLFFAERYHLRKYARTITEDTFFAMKLGPVASGAKDILDNVGTKEGQVSNAILERISTNIYKSKQTLVDNDYEELSETDKEALNFAFNTFSHLAPMELVEETHKYPEWSKFSSQFSDTSSKRENIDINDFFSELISDDDPYKCIPQEHVKLSQELFTTGF